ncbi:MAG: MmgE/PrpD family protein [Pseudomonadota bacterium]
MTTRRLAEFCAGLQYADLPAEAVLRTRELFLDWLGSALAGRGARPVTALEAFADTMGPADGPAEILVSRQRTSPYFAALVNGAASHVVEQDDLHNASVTHPGTVVFPAALATAQALGVSGREFIAACAAGYEACARVGEFLGRSHYTVFHTTGTAGTLGAAAAVGRLLGLDGGRMLHAFGSAGTQAAGLWEFLRDAADSKQLHASRAAASGLLAAYLARDGFTGASRILEGEQGMAAGMSRNADASKLTAALGSRWAVTETSIKYHASCRHTHPAADALLMLVTEHDLAPGGIARITVRVYRAALDVLGPVKDPQTIHQSKFCMGFVLALIAVRRSASVLDFTEQALADPQLRDLLGRVEMVLDPDVDGAYPAQWSAVVEVETRDGRRFSRRIEVPKGDPGNRLTPEELEEKFRRLAGYAGAASPAEAEALIRTVADLEGRPVGPLLAGRGKPVRAGAAY